jgi:hypothetical protein
MRVSGAWGDLPLRKDPRCEPPETPGPRDRAGDRRHRSRPSPDPQLGVDPAPGATDGYVGAGKQAFYSVEQRMAALEARVAAGRAPRAVRAELAALKAFEARQRARRGGELRDWDREAMSARLNRIEPMVAG